MTKLLVMSDSHRLIRPINDISVRHHVDMKIHCGDSELAYDSEELSDFFIVKGNCDSDQTLPDEEIIQVGDMRIFVTHGHLYGVKRSLMQLRYRALEIGADIVLFGHSHIAYCEQIDRQLFINPGSIQQPRKWNVPTYCLLEVSKEAEVNVHFHDIKGNRVNVFPFEDTFSL